MSSSSRTMHHRSPDHKRALTSTIVYTGRVFRVRSDRVRLPGGGTSILDIVEHAGAVVIVPVLDDGRLVMVRQYRYAVDKHLLEFPAGTLEPEEDPETCAQRELREETGYAAGSLKKLAGYYLAPGYSTEYLHVYLGTDLSAAPLEGDEDELVEVEIVGVEAVRELAYSGRVEDAKSLAALYMAAPALQASINQEGDRAQ